MTSDDSTTRPYIELFTDGACSGNPGPGGWAYILRHMNTGAEKEVYGGHASTTNNRMELTAVIEGLSALQEACRVDLYSDSQYLVKGLTEWLDGWKAKGWRGSNRKPVKNQELWRRLDELRSRHELICHWVRGHDAHEENERCDRLAVKAIDRYR